MSTLQSFCNPSSSTVTVEEDLVNSAESNESSYSTEVSACCSFIEEFTCKYNSSVTLHATSLKEAISSVCFAPIQSRKVIALYFHNDNDLFSRMFCSQLSNPFLNALIEKYFYMIGWDVANEMFHSALKKSLDENLPSEKARERAQVMLVNKTAALLILYPIENSITVFSVLNDGKNFIATLKIISRTFEAEIKDETELETIRTENNIDCSKMFHQIICDRLSDRDYDCFEYYEHGYLKQKIGFALHGPPQSENGYNEEQVNEIEEIYKKIQYYNNEYSKWKDEIFVSFIFNCLEALPKEKLEKAKKYPGYNPDTDVQSVPIFVIRKCRGSDNPCRIYLDTDNRMYKSWNEYIDENKLCKYKMVLPLNGRYASDENDEVLLERHLSPSCGISRDILKGADIATALAGLASGGVFLAALIPSIAVAPIAIPIAVGTGVGVTVYSLVRNGLVIKDRLAHGETMVITNSEARGAYLNIIAATIGFAGAGTTTVMSQLAARGIEIAQGARIAANTVSLLSIGANGISMANSSYNVLDDLLSKQGTPSALTVGQLQSSILFFGNVNYNFDERNSDLNSQVAILEQHQDALQFNRQRRILGCLTNEVDTQEVISGIFNMENEMELFEILKRNGKMFHHYGVKFSMKNNQIQLNGIAVNLFQFSSMTECEKTQFLSDLSEMPSVTDDASRTIQTLATIRSVFSGDSLVRCGQLDLNDPMFISLASKLLKYFSRTIQEKVVTLCKVLCNALIDFIDLKKIFPALFVFNQNVTGIMGAILILVIKFIKINMNSQNAIEGSGQLSAAEDPVIYCFEKVVNVLVIGHSVSEGDIMKLVQYVMNIIAEKLFASCYKEEKNKKREINCKKNPVKIECKICNGFYYSTAK